ncbi:MAG: single-stranded-DNA-specific exonuclease RecJ, partial [Leptolyngbyaceae cyanobacterium SL_7_1]|nr:single-stranded-DNA-specific exonuclease RecJ [Leptolyngbyaceae cyanobacterium SL_7_1]
DHHTLPTDRPPVVALLNSRCFPSGHPLSTLSGVAVAFKLIEALYTVMPAEQPLEELLDLVAIGLIADLVELTGDCRYLAQRGIEQLQKQRQSGTPKRPGIARLLELCRKNGDRPTDISYGIGPRINAISRIYGDARFAVELLTSQAVDRCQQLAEDTELANTRRKALQKEVVQQVRSQLNHLDLSTTSVIVLSDPQWSVGVLGLVAGQIAQEYDRPTILLSTDVTESATTQSEASVRLARGSARSIHSVDLYQLVNQQSHLLHRFGGHPYAAGLSLPIENISLFSEAINRQHRLQELVSGIPRVSFQADLAVTVAELGQELFRQLKGLEPYGMGNPTPKLLLRNVWFNKVHHQNIYDWKKRKVRYIKTEFEVWDESASVGFPGIWWEHYKDEIPTQRSDIIAELDFNPFQKRYEIRLVAIRPSSTAALPLSTLAWQNWLLDYRGQGIEPEGNVFAIARCPSSWDELYAWLRHALQNEQKLAIAYSNPSPNPAIECWQQLVGIAKYLSRTRELASQTQLQEKLDIGDRVLHLGFKALRSLGLTITIPNTNTVQMQWQFREPSMDGLSKTLEVQSFLEAVQEEYFRRRYFYHVPLSTIQTVLEQNYGLLV